MEKIITSKDQDPARWNPFRPCEPSNTELAVAKSQDDKSPVDPKKAATKLWCESYLLVEMEDFKKDVMIAKSTDLDFYMRNGFMCYEHPTLATTLVGRNTSCWLEDHPSGKPAVKQRGYFYGNDPDGKQLFNKMMTLFEAEDDPTRHLGTSPEGKSQRAVPRGNGGHTLYDNLIWGTAVTLRPQIGLSRFTAGEYEIAASLNAAASGGYLEQHLRALLDNAQFNKNLRQSVEEASESSQVLHLVNTYGFSKSQARAVINHARERALKH